jgi:hypothetical protein
MNQYEIRKKLINLLGDVINYIAWENADSDKIDTINAMIDTWQELAEAVGIELEA